MGMGTLDTDWHTGRHHVKMEAGMGGWGHKPGNGQDGQRPQEAGEAWTLTASEGTSPA